MFEEAHIYMYVYMKEVYTSTYAAVLWKARPSRTSNDPGQALPSEAAQPQAHNGPTSAFAVLFGLPPPHFNR